MPEFWPFESMDWILCQIDFFQKLKFLILSSLSAELLLEYLHPKTISTFLFKQFKKWFSLLHRQFWGQIEKANLSGMADSTLVVIFQKPTQLLTTFPYQTIFWAYEQFLRWFIFGLKVKIRSKSSELLSIRYIRYFCCISVNAVLDGDCRLSLSVALRSCPEGPNKHNAVNSTRPSFPWNNWQEDIWYVSFAEVGILGP